MTETEKNLAAFLKGGGTKVVGAVVMWSLSGVRVRRHELRAAMTEIGLAKAVPKDPKPERILAKAVDAARAGVRGILFRKTGKREWAIVEETEREDGTLDHRHVITLLMVKSEKDDQWSPQANMAPDACFDENYATPEAHALADAVQRHYETAWLYADTEDLSQILTATMMGTAVSPMLGAVSLREGTGGVYFVPGASVPAVLALRALVDGLHGNSHVTALTLYGDESNLAEASLAAKSSFTAKLNDLQGELATFVAEMEAGGKTMTDKHVETRVQRLTALRERVEMWGDALGDVRAELFGSIETATADVAEAMGL